MNRRPASGRSPARGSSLANRAMNRRRGYRREGILVREEISAGRIGAMGIWSGGDRNEREAQRARPAWTIHSGNTLAPLPVPIVRGTCELNPKTARHPSGAVIRTRPQPHAGGSRESGIDCFGTSE